MRSPRANDLVSLVRTQAHERDADGAPPAVRERRRRPSGGAAQGAAARSLSSSGPAASRRKASWVSPPTRTSATSVKPASQ